MSWAFGQAFGKVQRSDIGTPNPTIRRPRANPQGVYARFEDICRDIESGNGMTAPYWRFVNRIIASINMKPVAEYNYVQIERRKRPDGEVVHLNFDFALRIEFTKRDPPLPARSEEHTSELQSLRHLVCR